jgi:exodeoxyribonuclease I
LHVNKSPFVCASLQTLSDARAEQLGIDRPLALHHAAMLQGRTGLLAGLWPDVFLPHADASPVEAEADLYGGFVPNADRLLLSQLRGLAPQDLAQRVHEGRIGFADPRLGELLARYRARSHPETLDPQERLQWEQYRAQRLHVSGPLTLAQYLEQIDALQQTHEDDERCLLLLDALVDWAEAIAPPHPDDLGFAAS